MPRLSPVTQNDQLEVSETQVESFLAKTGMLDKLSQRDRIPQIMENVGIGLEDTVRHLAQLQKYCDEPTVKLNAIKLNFQVRGLMNEDGKSTDTQITFNISGTSAVKVEKNDLTMMLNPRR